MKQEEQQVVDRDGVIVWEWALFCLLFFFREVGVEGT